MVEFYLDIEESKLSNERLDFIRKHLEKVKEMGKDKISRKKLKEIYTTCSDKFSKKFGKKDDEILTYKKMEVK